MDHYAGIDVSLESSSVSEVEASGRIVREAKVASEPEALMTWFGSLGFGLARIGLEAGPLSQLLYAAMKQAGLAVELLETRHVSDAFKAVPSSRTAATPSRPLCHHRRDQVMIEKNWTGAGESQCRTRNRSMSWSIASAKLDGMRLALCPPYPDSDQASRCSKFPDVQLAALVP